MPKISQEEHEILKGIVDRWKWIARDEDGELSAYRNSPYRSEYGQYWVAKTAWEEHHLDVDLFQSIQWTDEEPYNIAELIEEYEYSTEHVSHVVNERVEALGNAWKESEETEVKDIEWLKKWVEEYENKITKELGNKHATDFMTTRFMTTRLHGGQSAVKEIKDVINQLDEPEPQNITLQDIMHRLWKLPLNNRKYWLEQLNDEFQEGYIVPLGLKTTDGEEQYLTLNGSYFASRRDRYLQQTFATLEEIPEFYRDLAERVL